MRWVLNSPQPVWRGSTHHTFPTFPVSYDSGDDAAAMAGNDRGAEDVGNGSKLKVLVGCVWSVVGAPRTLALARDE